MEELTLSGRTVLNALAQQENATDGMFVPDIIKAAQQEPDIVYPGLSNLTRHKCVEWRWVIEAGPSAGSTEWGKKGVPQAMMDARVTIRKQYRLNGRGRKIVGELMAEESAMTSTAAVPATETT